MPASGRLTSAGIIGLSAVATIAAACGCSDTGVNELVAFRAADSVDLSWRLDWGV